MQKGWWLGSFDENNSRNHLNSFCMFLIIEDHFVLGKYTEIPIEW